MQCQDKPYMVKVSMPRINERRRIMQRAVPDLLAVAFLGPWTWGGDRFPGVGSGIIRGVQKEHPDMPTMFAATEKEDCR
jgi:hypothetical protein